MREAPPPAARAVLRFRLAIEKRPGSRAKRARAKHRLKRLKALEEENRKLKKLLAEQMLDAATLREMLGKNF